MAVNLTRFSANVNNIQGLSDRPNTIDGLTSAELKAKFDKAGSDIKEYLNGTLVPQSELNLTQLSNSCLQNSTDISNLDNDLEQLTNNIGSLSNLKTDAKTNIISAINEIAEDVYSTQEIKTNKIYVDANGNRYNVYRKKLFVTSPSGRGSWIAIASLNFVNKLTFMDGWLYGKDGRQLPINHSEPSFQISTTFKKPNIEMQVWHDNWINRTVEIDIEYTKVEV